ncbi:squalene cyclase [Thermococcus sp. Bubb.Bath]|uniref:squalene cyclase n=1 Tax=Thermococcus sp. Bubb.Bath TaxID=1638242 RepID=UPI0014387D6A|nr:squalene cyclase [Thermococcus sp. Bubb.Bath]NJF26126.1 squalene cyclase [Thermococcus sp. Bubb.Bath]
MRGFSAITVALIVMLVLPLGSVSAREVPYVYNPTTPAIALSVLAFYRSHDYPQVLEGCTWLVNLKTPDGAWAYQYGMAPQAKYTALAVMALIRGESLARGMFNKSINAGVYWLMYKQGGDGSFGDYTDTALAVVALKEYAASKYSWLKVGAAIHNGIYYLETHSPKTTMDVIFGGMALDNLTMIEAINATGVNALYRAFAISYLTGRYVNVSSTLTDAASLALLLYSTGKPQYKRDLLDMEHFGFWGTLKYNPVDLLEASTVPGFSNLTGIACPYMEKVKPHFKWERVVLAKYYVECGFSVNLSGIPFGTLKPWQVSEIARIDYKLSKPYGTPVEYLLSHEENGHWGNFFDTAYIVWVLSTLNVRFNYTSPLEWLQSNLTNDYPNYYYAYALVDFHRFGLRKAFNTTLRIISSRQNPSGAWGYTAGTPGNIKSTAMMLKALREVRLENTTMYKRGVEFLRRFLYADIPKVSKNGSNAVMNNATFFVIKDGKLVGDTQSKLTVGSIDGYIVVYPGKNPLVITAVPVNGFTASSPWRSSPVKSGLSRNTSVVYTVYIGIVVVLIVIGAYAILKERWKGNKKNG